MAYYFIICFLLHVIWESVIPWCLILNIVLSILPLSPKNSIFYLPHNSSLPPCLRTHIWPIIFLSLTLLLKCHRIKLNFHFIYLLPHLTFLRINKSFTLSLHFYQNQCKLCYIYSHWFFAPIVRLIDRMLST